MGGGEAVMHLNVLKRAEVQHDRWTPFGVSSLRAGSWMLRLNELAACLRTADQPHDEGAKPNASTFIDRKGPRW